MDAPKCKLCGERHYGACPSFEEVGRVGNSNRDRAESGIHQPVGNERSQRPPAGAQAHPPAVDVVASEPPKPWRRGRRIAGEAHLVTAQQKPWLALGMSRATYYRRKRAGKL